METKRPGPADLQRQKRLEANLRRRQEAAAKQRQQGGARELPLQSQPESAWDSLGRASVRALAPVLRRAFEAAGARPEDDEGTAELQEGAKPMEELRSDYMDRGFAPDLRMGRDELLLRLEEASAWEALPDDRLLQVCRRRRLPVGEAASHAELMRALAEATWEAQGIPASRLLGATAARDVLRQVWSLEALGTEELAARCRQRGFYVGPGATRPDLVNLLRDLAVWEKLPLGELRQLCVERGGAEGCPNTRWQLVQRLIELLSPAAWEQRGIPKKRLQDPRAADALFWVLQRLEAMPADAVRAAYQEIGLPPEPGMQVHGYRGLMKTFLIWECLSVEELRKEYDGQGVHMSRLQHSLSEEEERCELVDRLVTCTCVFRWQAQGIPVWQIGSIEAVSKVARRWEALEHMDHQSLQAEIERIGSSGEDKSRLDVITCLKARSAWMEMPLTELLNEAQARDQDTSSLQIIGGCQEDQRRQLVDQLSAGTLAHATLPAHWRSGPFKGGSAEEGLRTAREEEQLPRPSPHAEEGRHGGVGGPAAIPQGKEDQPSEHDLHDAHRTLAAEARPGGPAPTGVSLEAPQPARNVASATASQAPAGDASNQQRHPSDFSQGQARQEPSTQQNGQPRQAHARGEPDAQAPRHPSKADGQADERESFPEEPPPPRERPHRPVPRSSADAQQQRMGPCPANEAGSGQGRPWNDGRAWLQKPPARVVRHFKTLQLQPGASADDVRRAYKKLALAHHPDKNPGLSQEEATGKFREIADAYEVLCNYLDATSTCDTSA